MNDVLRQRLVGALILVALGVIFWPIIFVQPEDELVQVRNIPPQPNISTERVDAPDPVGLRTSPTIVADNQVEQEEAAFDVEEFEVVDPDEGQPDSDALDLEAEELEEPEVNPEPEPSPPPQPAPEPAPAPVHTPPEELKLDADGVPVAWILQVVTVSASEKAEEIRSRLDAMGHKAYVEKVTSGGRTLHRVYVGPKFEKGELESIKSQVDAEFGVSSMTRRYVP